MAETNAPTDVLEKLNGLSTISVFQPSEHKVLVKRDIEADVAEALADSGMKSHIYRESSRHLSFDNFHSILNI